MTPTDATTPVPQKILRLLLPTVLTALIVLTSAAAAFASQQQHDGGTRSPDGACSSTWQEDGVAADRLLPVNRWAGATNNFHSRTAGGLSFDILGKVQRDVGAGTLLAMGNGMWSGTTSLTTFATSFCVIDEFGRSADQAGAVLGDAILRGGATGSLVVALIVVSTVYMFAAGYRRHGTLPWRQLTAKLLVVGLFAVLLNGAMNTTDTQFGRGSPGWVISTLNNVVSSVASVPAGAISIGDLGGDDVEPGDPVGEVMSCERYAGELRQAYWDRHGSYGTVAGMPLVLNSIWETTGLAAWKTAQLGQNDHADMVYCRLLDEFAGIPVGGIEFDPDYWIPLPGSSFDSWRASRLGVMSRYWDGPLPAPSSDAIAWTPVDDKTRDVSIVGWALCEPDADGGWQYRPSAAGLLSDDGDGARAVHGSGDTAGGKGCAGWWEQPAVAGTGGFDDGHSVFNWGPDASNIIASTDGQNRDFLLTLHSNKAGSSTMVAFGYLLSSIVMFVVFGFLSVAIIIAKFLMVAMIIAVFIVLTATLLPRTSVGHQLAAFSTKLLGIILLTSFATLIFALVGAFTSIMVTMGTAAFDPGSFASMLWTGLAPLAALAAMSYIFTKVLKVPNPLSMKGALAWGTAAGAVGGAVGGAFGGSRAGGRIGQTLGRATRQAEQAAVDSAVSRATGGRLGGYGRRPGMTPLRRRIDHEHHRGTAAESATGMPRDGTRKTTRNSPLDGSANPNDRDLTRGERARARRATDAAALADLGIPEDADHRTKRHALNTHRRQQVAEARALTQQQWHQRNGDSVRSAIARRRETPAGRRDGALLPRNNGSKVALPRHVVGGTKDVATARLKDAGDAFRAAPVQSIGRGAKKIVTTGAKVGGIGLAAAALGPALPLAAASVGGTLLARKAWKSSAGDRLTGDRRALEALRAHRQKLPPPRTTQPQAAAEPGSRGTPSEHASTSRTRARWADDEDDSRTQPGSTGRPTA